MVVVKLVEEEVVVGIIVDEAVVVVGRDPL